MKCKHRWQAFKSVIQRDARDGTQMAYVHQMCMQMGCRSTRYKRRKIFQKYRGWPDVYKPRPAKPPLKLDLGALRERVEKAMQEFARAAQSRNVLVRLILDIAEASNAKQAGAYVNRGLSGIEKIA